MRSDRLFAILYLLAQHRTITAQQLAEKLEVSVRTVYRDIQALSEWGAPIRTETGPGGGLSLMEGAALDKALLNSQQQQQVLMALENFRVAGPEGEQTLSRLRSFFGLPEQSWIEVDFSCWGGGPDKGHFELLRQAILERRQLSFTYWDRQGNISRRQAQPAKLIFKTSAWYLQAFCLTKQAWRTFKVRRMEALELEQDTFPPLTPPALEPEEQWTPPVKLWFAPEHRGRVREEFEPDQVTLLPDGSFFVVAPLPADDWLVGYLLSFGGGLRVLDPPWLGRQMEQRAQRILDTLGQPENFPKTFSQIADSTLSANQAYDRGNKGEQRQKGEWNMENKDYQNMKFCQSCGMPLTQDSQHGTNKDGSLNQDYCSYCWKDGAFTWPEVTMEQMIDHCAPMMAQSGFTEEEARQRMQEWFPTLKRWSRDAATGK